MIQTTDMILSAIDKKHLTAIVLLDMSKAFDGIDHNLLLVKLEDVDASPLALQWFGSYLTARSQVVTIGTASSERLHVASGVPQGSIVSLLRSRSGRSHATLPAMRGRGALRDSGPSGCEGD